MRLDKKMCILKAHKNVVENIREFIYLQMSKNNANMSFMTILNPMINV